MTRALLLSATLMFTPILALAEGQPAPVKKPDKPKDKKPDPGPGKPRPGDRRVDGDGPHRASR